MEADALEFPRLTETLFQYGEAVKRLYKTKLTNDGKDASSALNRSVQFHVRYKDKGIMKSFQVTLEMEYYWKYVEYGRGPGKFPPMNKIAEWIRIKPVVPYPNDKGKLPTIKQLAFLISRKIATEGIKPTNILHNTLEDVNAEYLPKIRDAFQKDVGSHFALMIKSAL